MSNKIRDFIETATLAFLIMNTAIQVRDSFSLDFWQTLFVILVFLNLSLIIYKDSVNLINDNFFIFR